MKPSIKAALLSGLLFPGLGQWTLGRRKLGVAIITLTLLGAGGLIWGVARKIPLLVQQVMRAMEQGAISYAGIYDLSMQAVRNHDWWLERGGLYLMVGCWLFSIGHALLARPSQQQP
ncbi:MAG: hypothetical protein COX17_11120 [Deltaproteobacteria bacterium CG23_combo_of_CG06-09_8_20_14_all_60_8]|nr:MAG: hypothetical protein AUK28_07225 [Desulfobacterales bacterium CG2_30_60_27]PIP42712.1 MAG: hypothetical protein COX17_11120 [Deltaproteobacteria bacterium CG23_combo_of_CG06-09_8_20_14_all_60_8]